MCLSCANDLSCAAARVASIATAGLNNVLCMLPARDAAEADALPAADRAWLRGWLAFTDAHLAALRHTVPLVGLDEVGSDDVAHTDLVS